MEIRISKLHQIGDNMFFSKLFKKRKAQKEEIDLEAELSKHNPKGTVKVNKEYEVIEQMQYVNTQCEQIADSSKYIAELKAEYQIVENYLADVKIIEEQPEKVAKSIKAAADAVNALKTKRESIKNSAPLISASRFDMFEKHSKEFPSALTEFINDEKYCQQVKHDMQLLEAEKIGLKEDMKDYNNRRVLIRNISIISFVGICVIFGIFIATGKFMGDDGATLFMIVLLLAAIFVLLVLLLIRSTSYKFKLSEKKLQKAIVLLNKTKIKYVNIYSNLEYVKEKYNVKNSLELSKEYEAYLMEKKKAEKYRSSTVELDEAMAKFSERIAKLNLYDSGIWEKQMNSIYNTKEMEAIKTTLINRRNKLKSRIEYNMEQIEHSKNSIIQFVKKNPDMASEVMNIVESYDVDF